MSKILEIKTKEIVNVKELGDYLANKKYNVVIKGDDEFLKIYIDKVSTRFISLEKEGNIYDLKINVVSCKEDYALFRDIAYYILSNLKCRAEFEGEKTDADNIIDLFNEGKINQYIESDIDMILVLLRHGIKEKGHSVMTIFGPNRSYCIGPWVIESLGLNMDSNPEIVAPLLFDAIRYVQYSLPDNLRENSHYLSMKSKDGSDDINIGPYFWNKYDITSWHEYFMLSKTDFIADEDGNCVIIPSEKLGLVAPKSWKRIDECQFLTAPLSEQEYIEFWNRAKQYQTDNIYKKEINEYKLHVVGVKSDQNIFAQLCKKLKEDNFSVYPSSEDILEENNTPKESMQDIEECDAAIIMQTRNTGRNKQYQKEVMRLIAKGTPFITISIKKEDVLSAPVNFCTQNIFESNEIIANKYSILKEDIKEMCQWISFKNADLPYRESNLKGEELEKAENLFEAGCEASRNGEMQKAYDLLYESAEMGFSKSMFILAIFLNKYANDVENSQEMQLDLLERAASYGHIPALNALGGLYEEKQDYSKSMEYYKDAAKDGLSCACGNISDYYYTGEHFRKNLGKALFWISNAYASESSNVGFDHKEEFDQLLEELFAPYE